MVEARLTSKPAPERRRFLRGTAALGLIGALTFGFMARAKPEELAEWWDGLGRSHRYMERNASTCLKTVTSAQADYRANDRDWNHINDFWRGDIAGLYTLKSAADPQGPAIKLIELSVACADDRPITDISPYAVRSAKAGYWFRSILHEDEARADPDRFAACAFPDSRAAGKYTFIVDETNTIYRKELGKQRGIERYPLDPVKAGWQKLD